MTEYGLVDTDLMFDRKCDVFPAEKQKVIAAVINEFELVNKQHQQAALMLQNTETTLLARLSAEYLADRFAEEDKDKCLVVADAQEPQKATDLRLDAWLSLLRTKEMDEMKGDGEEEVLPLNEKRELMQRLLVHLFCNARLNSINKECNMYVTAGQTINSRGETVDKPAFCTDGEGFVRLPFFGKVVDLAPLATTSVGQCQRERATIVPSG